MDGKAAAHGKGEEDTDHRRRRRGVVQAVEHRAGEARARAPPTGTGKATAQERQKVAAAREETAKANKETAEWIEDKAAKEVRWMPVSNDGAARARTGAMAQAGR